MADSREVGRGGRVVALIEDERRRLIGVVGPEPSGRAGGQRRQCSRRPAASGEDRVLAVDPGLHPRRGGAIRRDPRVQGRRRVGKGVDEAVWP